MDLCRSFLLHHIGVDDVLGMGVSELRTPKLAALRAKAISTILNINARCRITINDTYREISPLEIQLNGAHSKPRYETRRV
jgi:hypothetical protein